MPPGNAIDQKELVRQATDIVDLVGSYLQLRRQGRGYVGLCPWHEDSRPSLQVNPERQSFKCWVCNLGGDVFSFLMKMDNLDFREALEQLADRAGIDLAPAGAGPRPEAGSPGDKNTLLAAMAWAVERYHRCLHEDAAADPARRYLAERGVSDDSVARFRLGFAPPGWDWLLRQGPAARFSPAVLERVNLIAVRKSGDGHYDQFRGRLLFPIHDVRSRPVAIGGRVLPELAAKEERADYKPAKYVNSSETPVYTKSRELYALDLAKDAIQKADSAIVVEGYTDVIGCHQAGVRNVVAACGTAMGEGHLQLLRRFTERIVLVLDGDDAGRRRASELLELFVSSPVDLRILTLPGGLDPCDFVASHGGDKFAALVANAPDALEHRLLSVTDGMVLSADKTHDASQAVEQVLGTLAKARPSLGQSASSLVIREQALVGRLARHFRIAEEGLRARLADLRRGAATTAPLRRTDEAETAAPRSVRADSLPPWDREAITLMLAGPELAAAIAEGVDEVDFASHAARDLFARLRDLAETTEATYDRLMLSAEDDATKTLIVELGDHAAELAASDAARRHADLLAARTRRQDGAERGARIRALQDGALPDQEADRTLADLFASRRNRETGTPSTEG